MPISFYLSTRSTNKGEKSIYASISVHGYRYCANIGYNILPEYWDSVNGIQMVRKKICNMSGISSDTINARMSAIRSVFIPMEGKMDKEQVSKQHLKDQFNKLLNRRSSTGSNDNEYVTSHIDEFIREGLSYNQWSRSTVNKMHTLRNHINKLNPEMRFSDLNEKGLNSYLLFCTEVIEMIDSTVAKEFKLLKWYLNWAYKKGYNKETAFNDFSPKLKETKKPVIFLTKEELKKLLKYEIPATGSSVELIDMYGKTYSRKIEDRSSLDKVRDLFCFCAFTSLRYSDMAQLKRTDIVNGKIRVVTQKTDEVIEIELNPMAKSILDKYKAFDFAGLALPVISNQKMNQYLKNICELCGFNSPVTITQYSAGERIEMTFPKWMVISTHAGRRTFICQALASGIPPHIVMKWTGHSSYEAMKPYIEVAENIKEKEMERFTKTFEL